MGSLPIAPEPFELPLELNGPLDIPASVARFRRWGDDLLDRWDGQTFVRATTLDGAVVPYACTVAGTVERPQVRVLVGRASEREGVAQVVRELFSSPNATALAQLAAEDPALGRLHAAYPGFRGIRHTDGLASLVRAISAQQVNLTWAATTRRRLVELVGERYAVGPHMVYALSAPRLAQTTVAQLRELQFTTRKAEYLVDIARRVVTGALDLPGLAALSDAAVIESLVAVRGIGRWTAEWYLARTLGRPVVVAGDLGVRKAVGALYLGGAMPTEAQVRGLTAHWRLAAGAAQELALHGLAQAYAFAAPTGAG